MFLSEEVHLTLPSYHNFLSLSAASIIRYFGLMDAATYIKSALFFLQHGSFETWVSNLWPPGQALLIAAIFKISGQTDYPLKMLYITLTLWTFAFGSVYQTLEGIKNKFIKIFLTLIPFYFHSFQSWIFDMGLLMTENVSLPLFVIALCFCIHWIKYNKRAYLITAAALLALLAYFRGYFEVFGRFITIAIIIYLIILWISNYFNTLSKKVFTPQRLSIVVSLVIFHLLLLPWRIYQFHHNGSFSWQGLSPVTWSAFWEPAVTIFPDANIPCKLYPTWCAFLHMHHAMVPPEFYRTLTVAAFFNHPLQWYAIKIKLFNLFWFSENTWYSIFHQTMIFAQDIFLLATGILTFLGCGFLWFKKHLSDKRKNLFLLFLFFTIFNVMLFTFFHYEPRYSLFLKILFIYSPVWFIFGLRSNKLCIV